MAFQRVKLSEASSFKEMMLAAAKYEPKRSMSNIRLVGSAVSISLGLMIAYCSLFYVPAFVDFKGAMRVVGIDQDQKPLTLEQQAERAERWGVLAPYIRQFQLPRGYLRSGQKLHVQYALSPGTELTLSIKRCASVPILEVFKCQVAQEQTVNIRRPLEGVQTFRVSEPGFYYYTQATVNRDGSEEVKPYAVMWQRRH